MLVARPEPSALDEAARTAAELADAGMGRQLLALNGVFTLTDDADPTARSLAEGQAQALAGLAGPLAALERVEVPLHGFAPLGVDALAAVLDPGRRPAPQTDDPGVGCRRGPPGRSHRRARGRRARASS